RIVAERALAATAGRLRLYRFAEAAFQQAAFGQDHADDDLAVFFEQRALAAHRLMLARGFFLPLHLAKRLPPVLLEVASPAEVAEAQGARLSGAAPLWPAPPATPIETSRAIEAEGVRTFWLAFRSPVMGDLCRVRVEEPLGIPALGTLVFLHGLGMETEFWREL